MHSRNTGWVGLILSGLTVGLDAAQRTLSLSKNAQSLLDYANYINGLRFDGSYKYIKYPDNGPMSVRFTAWYTAGLLYRNNGTDAADAREAIENILSCQYIDQYESAWYGTFKLSPDEPDPTPDSELYPPSIYNTYDPNWREFIGTQLVQLVEEFPHLLGKSLISQIEDSLEIAAVGSMRRNGSYPEGDNLITAYSNPGLMRAWYVGWIGERRNNQTLINYANTQGALISELFNSTGSEVLSEYNAPTYYGIDVWALAGNIKYGAKNATLTKNAGYILTELWKDIANHYNPYLANLAGPYDRAYSRDLTQNSAVINYFWWSLYGYNCGPQSGLVEADLLYDVAQGAGLALVTDVVAAHISHSTTVALTAKGSWEGERMITKKIPSAIGPGAEIRVATSWISAPLMIGAEQLKETVNRGQQFVPALVQWAGDKDHTPYPYMTFFSFYPTASTIKAVAGPKSLEISYPNTTQEGTNIFSFALAQVPPSWTLTKKKVITGLTDLPCLDVVLDAPGLVQLPVVYGATLEDNLVYNISWSVPANFTGTPSMKFTFEYTC